MAMICFQMMLLCTMVIGKSMSVPNFCQLLKAHRCCVDSSGVTYMGQRYPSADFLADVLTVAVPAEVESVNPADG